MSLKRSVGSAEFMKRTIPKNAKYQHVKTKLDTGCSLTKFTEKLEEIKKNYRYRDDEIFKRLKLTTFAKLILKVHSVPDLNESDDGESQAPDDHMSVASDADLDSLSEKTSGSSQASLLMDHQDPGSTRDSCCSARSSLLSVISGVGELSLDKSNQKMKTESVVSPDPTVCPYLLLDVRDRDQYNCCHIISAHSFPVALLSRTTNPDTRVQEYKNANGKIIIVYDEDERIASKAATIMCQRGFENLFMLSGGLKVIAQKFPEGMTTGSLPTSCSSSPAPSKGQRTSVPLQPAEERWRFTSDELAKIQKHLYLLIPSNSPMSSSQSTAPGARSQWRSPGRDSARVQSSRPWK